MSIAIKNIIPAKRVENSATTQYTANLCTTKIDACTVTNTTATAVTLSMYLGQAGDSVGDDICVIKNKSIAAYEAYPCYQVVGKALENGDFLSAIAGTSDALTISASGREQT